MWTQFVTSLGTEDNVIVDTLSKDCREIDNVLSSSDCVALFSLLFHSPVLLYHVANPQSAVNSQNFCICETWSQMLGMNLTADRVVPDKFKSHRGCYVRKQQKGVEYCRIKKSCLCREMQVGFRYMQWTRWVFMNTRSACNPHLVAWSSMSERVAE